LAGVKRDTEETMHKRALLWGAEQNGWGQWQRDLSKDISIIQLRISEALGQRILPLDTEAPGEGVFTGFSRKPCVKHEMISTFF
jgi:hypothetical protein